MDISDTLIDDANLSKLDLRISKLDYLEEKVSRFTEVITKDKVQKIAEEPKVSNFEKKKKRQATLRKEKRDAWAAASLSAGYFCRTSTTGPMSGLFALFTSALSSSTKSTLPVPHLSALSACTWFAGSTVLVLYLSALSTFAGFAGSAGLVSGLSASSTSDPFASALSASVGSIIPVPGSSTPSTSVLSVSAPSASLGSAVSMFGLSTSTLPVFGLSAFFELVIISTPRRQKLIELNQKEKKAISEVLAPAFIPLLLSKPLFLFSVSCIGKKRSFNKAFNINSQLLTKNQFGKNVDLSFASCKYLLAV